MNEAGRPSPFDRNLERLLKASAAPPSSAFEERLLRVVLEEVQKERARSHSANGSAELLKDFPQSVPEWVADAAQKPSANGEKAQVRHSVDGSSMEPISIIVRASSRPKPRRLRARLVAYFSQIGPFSYVVSGAVMCVACLVAWNYEIADRSEWTANIRSVNAISSQSASRCVGRVTGTEDCRLADNVATRKDQPVLQTSTVPALAPFVSLGQRIHLDSGLIEITYDSGSKVILQGPAVFEIDSNGGLLSMGRLTGRLEGTLGGSNPQSPNATPLPFAIRTPTAVVTDLGTEFGVEVDKDGRTTSYVFRGMVKLHSTTVANRQHDILLNKGEAASADVANVSGDVVRRIEVDPNRFVRRVKNQRVRIRLFDTGEGMQINAKDPHWQVVAKSNNPGYQPRAAIVASPLSGWLDSAGGKSRWIEAFMEPGDDFYNDVTYTYRTTFELADALPNTAVIQGWYAASRHLCAVRLNDQEIPLPAVKEPECDLFHKLLIDRGFVDGTNVLEWDVLNVGSLDSDRQHSIIGLCVELQGSIQLK